MQISNYVFFSLAAATPEFTLNHSGKTELINIILILSKISNDKYPNVQGVKEGLAVINSVPLTAFYEEYHKTLVKSVALPTNVRATL